MLLFSVCSLSLGKILLEIFHNNEISWIFLIFNWMFNLLFQCIWFLTLPATNTRRYFRVWRSAANTTGRNRQSFTPKLLCPFGQSYEIAPATSEIRISYRLNQWGERYLFPNDVCLNCLIKHLFLLQILKNFYIVYYHRHWEQSRFWNWALVKRRITISFLWKRTINYYYHQSSNCLNKASFPVGSSWRKFHLVS